MTKIKPFKALIFNQEKIKDLSKVICPPYDIISPAQQLYYHDNSPYNFIHILLGKDAPGEDKYKRAAQYFKEWINNKILIQDASPAVYFYSQQYNIKGEKRTRFGFISLLRLGEKNKSVFAHEHTRIEPKEDRLRLMRQVKANLSPIFSVFLDKKRIIQRLLRNYINDKLPFIDVADDEKAVHKLWRIDDPKVIAIIENSMLDENIFIADGHHRYEVACAYRDEMIEKSGGKGISGEEDFNYIMSYFTNTDPRGLTILPVHRLLKLDKPKEDLALAEELAEYFDVEEIKDKTKFFFLMEKGGRTEHVLGMYKNRKYWLLRLKNIRILDKMISDKPKEYRALDVSILNYLVLKNILGYDLENDPGILFSPNAEEFIERSDKEDKVIVFLLNPVKIEQIMAVALNQERMPPKSTYFYPKALSGLLINKLEGS